MADRIRIDPVNADGTDRPVGIYPRSLDSDRSVADGLRQRLVDAFCRDHRGATHHPTHGACELGTRMVAAATPAVAEWLRAVATLRGDDTLHQLADEVTR